MEIARGRRGHADVIIIRTEIDQSASHKRGVAHEVNHWDGEFESTLCIKPSDN